MMLKSLDEVKITVSSAYVMTFVCFSEIKIDQKRKGPMMNPRETLVYTGMALERAPWY